MRGPSPLIGPRVLVCVAAAAIAGCGRSPLDLAGGTVGAGATGGAGAAAGAGGSAGAAGAPASFATPSGFCEAYESAYTTAARRCYGAGLSDAAVEDFFGSICGSLDGFLAAGTLAYDRANAAACLAHVQAAFSASCRFEDLPCVDEVLAGRVADGAPCLDSSQCGRRSTCARLDPAACGPKVCVPASGAGQVCGQQCQDGLVCSNDDLCVSDTGQPGSACDLGAPTSCDWTFACRASGGGGATCVAAATGDACADDLECPIEDFCDGTCKARLPVGASCVASPQGCIPLATCLQGRCVPAGQTGFPCGLNGFCFNSVCGSPFMSNVAQCIRDESPGSPCDDPAECESGVCAGGVCVSCSR